MSESGGHLPHPNIPNLWAPLKLAEEGEEISVRNNGNRRPSCACALLLACLAMSCANDACAPYGPRAGDSITILNASYDPTRELYREVNAAFREHWLERTGQTVHVQQSHGGSGSQSRAVIDGLDADVVTLALAYDIDAIATHSGLLPKDWRERLPHGSAPYTSTLAFLVRSGNPKNIRTWSDLAREDVSVITPNPKTSGVARWNYLAMWGYALRHFLGEDFTQKLGDPKHAEAVSRAQREASSFVASVYRNVPVLDRAARGATSTFVHRRIGDVLINWENEILLGVKEFEGAEMEIIVPDFSIRAEPVVALIDRNVDRRGTREAATAYLEFLYSDPAQEIAAQNYYRPIDREALARHSEVFENIELFSVDEVFGGWQNAHGDHFADGASFDRIYNP